VIVMDLHQWDVQKHHSNSLRKRPRDVEYTATEASRNGRAQGSHLESRDPFGDSWKRRNISQPSAGIWDSKAQTSLWLAQQNNLAPIASMNREEASQSSRTTESEQVFTRDEILNPVLGWPRGPGDLDRPQSQERRITSAGELLAATNTSKSL
jgi:hypothetical protein